MLRLDPAHPPIWRSATTLQFGADPVAIIRDPAPWQERLLAELERGIPNAALEPVATALGAPAAHAAPFVRRISRALVRPKPPADRVWVQCPDGFDDEAGAAVVAALRAAEWRAERTTWFGMPDETVPDAAPVVVLAHHLVEPRRSAALMGSDLAHLPIVFSGSRTEVGPFVTPGHTACLACVGAHRTDADPAWPHIAAQLIGRHAPAVGVAAAWEAGLVAARMLSGPERASATTHSLVLSVDSLHRKTQAHRPHAACGCRSLAAPPTRSPAETATAAARARPVPTTATAFALPA